MSVETGCGCTGASVKPELVEPDSAAEVTVTGTPLASGERMVPITIHTDSPLAPDVVLQFKMITDRKPPFLLDAAGDFAYAEDDSPSEVRELVVSTVEGDGPGKAPVAESDLHFLSVSGPFLLKESPYDESGLKQRAYGYRVSFKAKPPDASFAGRLRIIDPWTGALFKTIMVTHQKRARLEAIPPVVTIRYDGGSQPVRATLSILTRNAMPDLAVRSQPEGVPPAFEIREVTPRSAPRLRQFTVLAYPEKISGLDSPALVALERPDSPESDSLRIPVSVQRVSP